MTELAIRDDTTTAPTSVLVAWAMDARQAHQIAQSLARTAFVPASMRGKPEEVTAAILTGQELGLEPMASLRSIDVIEGTPAMRAHALRGLVQSKGHRVWVKESTATRAIVCGQRAGDDQVQTSTWTMDRANRQGLAGKSNWKRMPEAMLVARATAEVCRLIAADALLGMPYAVEELGDDLPASIVGTPEAPKRTARRKPLVAVPSAPPAPAEPELELPGDDPEPEPEPTGDTPPSLETWDDDEWPAQPQIPGAAS